MFNTKLWDNTCRLNLPILEFMVDRADEPYISPEERWRQFRMIIARGLVEAWEEGRLGSPTDGQDELPMAA